MKSLFTFALIALLNTPFLVRSQNVVKSNVVEATVYLYNASVESNAKATLKVGYNKITVTGLSDYIIDNSIQAKINGEANLISISPKLNVLKNKTEENNILKIKIESVEDKILLLNEENRILVGEEGLIKENSKIGNEKQGWSANELTLLSGFYRKRMTEIFTRKLAINKDLRKLREELSVLRRGNAKERKTNLKEFVLEVDAKKAGVVNIVLTYIVTNAGWKPSYEFRSESLDKALNVVYKAKIYQNTGRDWANIKLNVSTYQPSNNQNSPVLRPLYASIYAPNVYKKRSLGAVREMKSEALMMDVVSASSEDANYAPAPIAVVQKEQLNIVYAIKGKHSVKSGGDLKVLQVDKKVVDANYKYQTIPKMQESVFLVAYLKDWQELNLINAEAMIYLNDQYIGKMRVDPNSTDEKMTVSLGTDKRIVVKRKKLTDFSKIKKLKTNTEETVKYEINVKNNSGKEIELEIIDQIPISQDSRVSIVLEENKNGGKLEAKTGKLTWDKKIKNNSTSVSYSYIVTYPKSQTVQYRNR